MSDSWEETATVAETMTTGEVAKVIGTTREHVARLCRQDRLEARKVGRTWLVYEESVRRWLRTRKRGRPRKDARPERGEQLSLVEGLDINGEDRESNVKNE